MPNTQSFSCDSQTSCGIAVTRAASAAPAPSDTMTAGRTQHSRVALLASSAGIATAASAVMFAGIGTTGVMVWRESDDAWESTPALGAR